MLAESDLVLPNILTIPSLDSIFISPLADTVVFSGVFSPIVMLPLFTATLIPPVLASNAGRRVISVSVEVSPVTFTLPVSTFIFISPLEEVTIPFIIMSPVFEVRSISLTASNLALPETVIPEALLLATMSLLEFIRPSTTMPSAAFRFIVPARVFSVSLLFSEEKFTINIMPLRTVMLMSLPAQIGVPRMNIPSISSVTLPLDVLKYSSLSFCKAIAPRLSLFVSVISFTTLFLKRGINSFALVVTSTEPLILLVLPEPISILSIALASLRISKPFAVVTTNLGVATSPLKTRLLPSIVICSPAFVTLVLLLFILPPAVSSIFLSALISLFNVRASFVVIDTDSAVLKSPSTVKPFCGMLFTLTEPVFFLSSEFRTNLSILLSALSNVIAFAAAISMFRTLILLSETCAIESSLLIFKTLSVVILPSVNVPELTPFM